MHTFLLSLAIATVTLAILTVLAGLAALVPVGLSGLVGTALLGVGWLLASAAERRLEACLGCWAR